MCLIRVKYAQHEHIGIGQPRAARAKEPYTFVKRGPMFLIHPPHEGRYTTPIYVLRFVQSLVNAGYVQQWRRDTCGSRGTGGDSRFHDSVE